MGARELGWLAQTQDSQQLFPLRGVALASPCSITETVAILWSKNRTFKLTNCVFDFVGVGGKNRNSAVHLLGGWCGLLATN